VNYGLDLDYWTFLDSNLHTRLAIVTENELGNLPKKFRPDPSTFYLVIVVTKKQTNRQTDRQTNAGKNIIPRFRGDNYCKDHCSGGEIMTRERKCHSKSNRFVAAAEQVCLQPVLEHRQRRQCRRNIAWQVRYGSCGKQDYVINAITTPLPS